MKKLLIFNLLFLFTISVFLSSCREEFIKDFDDVLIINQAPVLSGLDTLNLTQGFEVLELDLEPSIYDQEGDELTIVVANENPEVVDVSISGTLLTIREVGFGSATIRLQVDDGVDRGEPVTDSFVVIVKEKSVEYKFFLDLLSIPSGTSVRIGTDGSGYEDYTMSDGTTIGTEEGDDDNAAREVINGELVWTSGEYDVMKITFPHPLDLRADATFEFEYADLTYDGFGMAIIDSEGGEAWFGYGHFEDPPWAFRGEMTLNDPEYNKFSLNLADFSGTVDLSSVTAIIFEKMNDDEAPIESFNLRNLGIGILAEPVWEMNFGLVAGGTSYDEITLADGTVIGRAEGSDGASRVVQNGVLEWTIDNEGWDVMSITFAEPLDMSSNPIFSMEYAELWNDMFGFTIFDSSGGEAGFGWEELPFLGAMVIADDSYNTFSFNMSEYAPNVDFSSITGFYIEKFEASQLETFKVKKISLGN